MIRFDHVSVSVPILGTEAGRRRRTLLHDLCLELGERRVAVVGPNGSGKSTLLRLINGLVTATAGRVEVDGHDPAREGRAVRRRVGFVFTDPLSQLVMPTPAEDVELSLRRTVRDRAERRERARAILAERGVAHVADQSIYDLSGGERQLVALASVLAVEPAVLVADEPTTLLDLRNKILMRRVFAALPQQLIVATHDLELAADADRVLVMMDGRVTDDGPPGPTLARYADLMAEP